MSEDRPPPSPPAGPAVDGVSLELIGLFNWRRTLNVRVTDDQLPFVADHQPVALVLLAKSFVGDLGDTWTPLAIVLDGEIVGVVGLADRGSVREIRHLAVDRGHQRRGIGAAAMAAVVERSAADETIDRIELTVHPDNDAAQRLYIAVGFRPTGAERDGEPFFALDLPSPG